MMRLSTLLAVAVCTAAILGASGCGRAPSFDQEHAFALLEEQCRFGPRPPGSAAHEAMMVWLIDQVSLYTDSVSIQRFTALADTGSVQMTNVIASFAPSRAERVLLGAHWDTRAVAERDPDPAMRTMPIPGANDGASGVAVLLEMARLLSERTPPIGVDLVFFDGEDGGNGGGLSDWCLGSSYYAASMGAYCPRYAVVVDMIGDADLAIPKERNSSQVAPEAVELVWEAARKAGSTSFENRLGASVYDDHVPLIRAGVPAVLVIDFDYRYWHTLEDTPEHCAPQSLGQVGRALVELIYSSKLP
jgi:glutaminyl-peptide cyclotransferase